jgi:arylsulfatase A-like enzyme
MASKQPNILLIFVDNQPAEMTGCYGNAEIHTPHLDKLAGGGVLFRRTYCPNAMCSPCRAAVLTGLMPSQHGIHTWLDDTKMDLWPENWNALAEFRTLPEMLGDQGYATALIGKYHLGLPQAAQNGFAHWVAHGAGHVTSFYDNPIFDNGAAYVAPGHSVDFFTDKAVDYIESRRADRRDPFFLFLTYPAPYGHWPSIEGPPENRYAELYRDAPMTSVPREGINRKVLDWIHMRLTKLPGEEEDFYKSLAQIPNDLPSLRNYYSQMTMVDDGVGRVVAKLEETGLAEDTLVVYTADHGMSLGHHGIWGHGEDSWPSNNHGISHHIPLIFSRPGALPPGTACDALVGTTDIFATILDYVGLDPPPRDRSPARTFAHLLEGEDAAWEDAVFMEQEETRSIRTREWLFMKRFRNDAYPFEDELYNIAEDPDESRDLATLPQCQGVVAELSGRIDTFFGYYADPRYDLWRGGTVKSNSSRPWLWETAWGPDWKPVY